MAKRALIIKDATMTDEIVAQYDFLKEYGVTIDVVDDSPDLNKEQFMNRFLTFETQGPDALPANEELIDKISRADIVISHFGPVGSRALENAKDLEAICILRSGVENVDVKKAAGFGIKVVNTPGRLAEIVSEFTVGLIVGETRNIARSHAALMEGRWQTVYYNSSFSATLAKKSIGIVGLGAIGTRVAKMMKAFGSNILVFDSYVAEDKIRELGYVPMELDQLFKEADVISLHYRLTPETRGMVGKRQIALMKPTAFLVNTARAGLIDNDALIEALSNHKIGGAALDVFDQEPLPPHSKLFALDNVTLTPHLSGTASNYDEISFAIMEDTLRHYFETGQWKNVVRE